MKNILKNGPLFLIALLVFTIPFFVFAQDEGTWSQDTTSVDSSSADTSASADVTPTDTGNQITSSDCTPPQVYDSDTGTCVTSAFLGKNCVSPQVYDSDTGTCVDSVLNNNSSTGGDSICLAYGPGTGCTTSSGQSGKCDSSNICQVQGGSGSSGGSSGTSGGFFNSIGTSLGNFGSSVGNFFSGSSGGTVYSVSGYGVSGGAVSSNYADYYGKLLVWAINSVLVPALIAIAFIVFLWGVYRYFILGAADEKEREKGRQFVLWGIIGFVIILSVWGLVYIVQDTLIPGNIGNTHPTYPTL